MKTLLLGSSTRFTATAGRLTGEDQLPTTTGFPELSIFTVTPGETAVWPALFCARAVRMCVPFVVVFVSQRNDQGGDANWAPRGEPSSRNCTPAMPTLSETDAETVDKLAIDPPAGEVIVTVGGSA